MNALAVVVVVVKHEQIFASVINSAICSLAPYACFDHLGNPQWLVNSNLKWILEKKPCQIYIFILFLFAFVIKIISISID